MKKLSVFIILFIMLISLTSCGKASFQTNVETTDTGNLVPTGFKLFSTDETSFSFLYPEEDMAVFMEQGGACVRKNEKEYLLVDLVNAKNMTPEKYFKILDRQMLKNYDHVESSTICEVDIEDKTLYMTRYICENENKTEIIERYIELYKNYLIQYTSVSTDVGNMNTEAYYAIQTLHMNEGAYVGMFTNKLIDYQSDLVGIRISLPEMLETKELTIGYLSVSDDALMLTILCTEDDDGNKIKGREDFIKKSQENPTFLSSYVGADHISYSSGTAVTINKNSFYEYPAEFSFGEETYTGKIILGEGSVEGCIVGIYAVDGNSDYFVELTELCEKSLQTLKY